MFEIIAIVGPTASGKTKYSIDLAKKTGYPLINADAYSVYKKMDIGTAKPSAKELDGIKNYMFDIVDTDFRIDINWYKNLVLPIIENEKKVILCGGSGLYIKSIIDNMTLQPFDENVRNSLYKKKEELGIDKLYEMLEKKDRKSIEMIPKNNEKRVIRALEVIEITGKPYSSTIVENEYRYKNTKQYMFDLPKDIYFDKIQKRTKKMLKTGLIEEVKELKDNLGVTAKKAIGYKETLEYLDSKLTLEELEELINLRTFQLVKKQITWFKKDKRIQTI